MTHKLCLGFNEIPMERIPLPEIKFLLGKSYCRQTSFVPELWTPDNPTLGHCSATVLVVQDLIGGTIRRGRVPREWDKKFSYPSHYWNIIDGKKIIDCTKQQFPEDFPYEDFINGKIGEISVLEDDKRGYLLSNVATEQRYRMLQNRFNDLLNSEPLYTDQVHMRLWDLAFSKEAKCPKLRFACQVYDGNKLLTESVNSLRTSQFGRERFCSLDGTSCIRLSVQSRTDAVLGDCDHSQIWALKDVFQLGYRPSDLHKLDFYEAGFNPKDYSPWWGRTESSYTCTYCENFFATFGLDKTIGVFNNRWIPFYTKDSFYSSVSFALGQKKV